MLRAEGFTCEVSSPGSDGGIDIFAGGGPLGPDNPRLIVQVKSSATPVESRVVRELHGVLSTHGADQALLVAWGGVNRTAQQEVRNQFLRLRVWDANSLLDAILRHYNSLPDAIRAEPPARADLDTHRGGEHRRMTPRATGAPRPLAPARPRAPCSPRRSPGPPTTAPDRERRPQLSP